MKRFFSLFFIVAILCLAMIMVSCGKEEADVAVPEIDNPASAEYHEHDLVSKVIKPTCVSNGYTEHTCKDCDYKFYDNFVTDKSAHNFGDGKYTVTVTPTCQVAKVEERTCKDCGFVDVKNGSTVAHSYTIFVEKEPYTCDANGYEIHQCKWCDETNKTTLYARHTFGAWSVDVPTLDAFGNCVIGLESRDCTVCEHHEEREIAAHTFNTVKVVDPTCATKGYTVYECAHCGLTYFDNYKDETGKHKYGNWVDYADYEGYEAHYCDTCGHVEYQPKED